MASPPSSTSPAPKDYDYMFRVILLGDPGVGKSSFLNHVITGNYSTAPPGQPSDYYFYNLTSHGKKVKIQLWDTAGQERFRNLTGSYFRHAQGVLILYDVAQAATFENVKHWNSEVDHYVDDETCKLVIGNKVDLTREITEQAAKAWCDDSNIPYMETSCLNGQNILESISKIVEVILTKQSVITTQDSNTIKLTNDNQSTKNKRRRTGGGC